MYEAYLNERYNQEDVKPFTLKEVAQKFEKLMAVNDRKIKHLSTGFVTYALQGDALIIYDMYVKPEYRGTKQSRKIHDALINTAQRMGKRVAITCSESAGKNQHLGLRAIKATGFSESYQVHNGLVFIKGI